MKLASDNTSGVCPEVLAALNDEAARFGAAYGNDPTSAKLTDVLGEVFERPVQVVPVATGTAANSLALAAINPPWGGVACHPEAHIAVDELSAPTLIGGGLTLIPTAGEDGRISLEALAELARRRDSSVHAVPLTSLSLTQSTEVGTNYQPDQIEALCGEARRLGMTVHMDGARFANAVAATNSSPADLTWRSGVDVLCLGATKGGALGAEAVVVFQPEVAEHLDRHRKRTGHLLSKQRMVSAQMLGWLQNDTWLRYASHANGLATRLAEGLTDLGFELLHQVESNMVFVVISPEQAQDWWAAGAEFYVQPTETPRRLMARFVTSWSSTDADIESFLKVCGEHESI